MKSYGEELNEKLWDALKMLIWCGDYAQHSDYYQHLDAARDLSIGLPEEVRESFMRYAMSRIRHMSNFSND